VAKNRKVNTLDSYATIRAVARNKPAPGPPTPPAAAESGPIDAPPGGVQKLGARVARTTVPVKHEIDCYECGYKFQVHGRVTTTHCPKCRSLLDLTDHTIDTEWVDTIKTAGTIRLTSTGVLKSGDLIGADLVLEGIIEGGRARASRTIELGAGAIFSEKAVSAPDLRVAAGAEFKFKQAMKYRNVELFGALHGSLEATGVITVKPGGLLEGEVRAEHLVVEDGGGLKAMLRIGPKSDAAAEGEETVPLSQSPL
jgi:cytoskeletal protein CcmA (bactofilin family)